MCIFHIYFYFIEENETQYDERVFGHNERRNYRIEGNFMGATTPSLAEY
jgi:hypothetical protein